MSCSGRETTMFEYDIPLSEPERCSIARIPKNLSVRTAFYGPDVISSHTFDGQETPNLQRPFLRIPSEDQTQIALRSNGPCIQCHNFLRKLVHLAREENTGIQGILELSARGHSIHDIGSSRSRELLGVDCQTLLLSLLASDSTRGTTLEYRKPCQEYCSNPL